MINRFARRRVLAAWAVVALCGLAIADPAAARVWRVAPDDSRIEFLYTADGKSEVGRFETFRARGDFDPKRLRTASLTLVVDIDSINLDDVFRTSLAKSEAWFDVKSHPRAEFRLSRLKRIDGAAHRAEGVLTIKGVTREIAVEMTLEFDAETARAVGEIAFDRLEFGVGDRAADLFVEIGTDVRVRFDLAARPAG